MDALQHEERAIRKLERQHLTKKREKVYVALEDLDFMRSLAEVWSFRRMWNEGRSVYDIARDYGRDPDEVVVLAMCQMRKGKIKQRPGGLMGGAFADGQAKQSNDG